MVNFVELGPQDRPDGLDSSRAPFEAWCRSPDTESYAGGAGLSPESQAMYRSLWDNWTRWLFEQGSQWDLATARLVSRFLRDREPQGYRRFASEQGEREGPFRMKAYTANRYYRVLTAVYTLAEQQGRLAQGNPLRDADHRASHIPADDRRMQVLPASLWLRARDPGVMAGVFSEGARWTDRRNHALMAVLFGAGLTVGELQRLGADCIVESRTQQPLVPGAMRVGADAGQAGPERVLPLQAEIFAAQGDAPLSVHVLADRSGGTVERTVPLDATASRVLLGWMGERIHLLRGAGLAAVELDRLERGGVIFLSTRVKSQGFETAMDAASIHRVVSGYLKQVHGAMPAAEAGAPVPHWGPATVRNCVVQSWVAERGPDRVREVLLLAGLGDHDIPRITEGALSGGGATPRQVVPRAANRPRGRRPQVRKPFDEP